MLKRLEYFVFRVMKLWQFIKLGWNDYDYDFAFLLGLERYKLRRMSEYFKRKPLAEYDWVRARDTGICARLLDIILEVDSSYRLRVGNKIYDLVEIKYVNTKNAERFFNKQEMALLTDKSRRIRIYAKDDLRRAKAWKLYNRIRECEMLDWWN